MKELILVLRYIQIQCYGSSLSKHAQQTEVETVFCIEFEIILFLYLLIIGYKKSLCETEAFGYFKNLKLGNSHLCGNFPHTTTHITNIKYHFLIIYVAKID